MKCNAKELALASSAPSSLEGRLNYRRSAPGAGAYLNQPAFKERWFRLINNYLFYFKISEMGKFDTSNPAGVFVMENSSIQMEHGQNIPFAFSISFIDEAEKRHIFAARSEESVVQWVMQLRACSYEYLRNKLHSLQSKIYSMTGNDPLLLVPRNEGAKLWAPSVPFSTAPACSSTSAGFSCHLHTNSHFTIERSKSAAICSATEHTASTRTTEKKEETKNNKTFGLERSKTTVVFQNKLNPFDKSIFDSDVPYTRPAPSPPVRRKPSPRPTRIHLEPSDSTADMSKRFAFTSILDQVPVVPRRKVSPKVLDLSKIDNDSSSECSTSATTKFYANEQDLITFDSP